MPASVEPVESNGDQPAILPPEQTSKWPKAIGVISLIYAICGLLCQTSYVAWTFLGEQFAKMGGMDIQVPGALKIMAVGVGTLSFILGIVMIAGAVNLLRRRRVGVKLLKAWAILRVVMLVVGIGLQVVTAPTSIRMQRSIEEATNRQLREAGREELPSKSDDQLWRESLIWGSVITGLFAIYPVFLGFYLSRRRITNEVEQWP